MRELTVTLVPSSHGATIYATAERRCILQARLPMPWHTRALPTVLEALRALRGRSTLCRVHRRRR